MKQTPREQEQYPAALTQAASHSAVPVILAEIVGLTLPACHLLDIEAADAAAGQVGARVAVDDVVAEQQRMVARFIEVLDWRMADDDGLASRVFFVELRADPEHVIDLVGI